MAKITRRTALSLVSMAGATYALSSWARVRGTSRARAADAAAPRRIVFFYTEQGTLKQSDTDPDGMRAVLKPIWTPQASGMPKDGRLITKPWQTSDFAFREILEPLTPHKKKILMLHGLDMVSNSVDPTGPANAHIKGQTHALVADNRLNSSMAGGISIDQHIARGINAVTPLTALPSLELYIDAHQGQGGGGEAAPLYVAAGQPLPMQGDAGIVYDRMFPNGPKSDENAAELQRLLARQKSVLDFSRQEFVQLSKQASAIDKARLDAHAAGIRDLESRISLGSNVMCLEPERSIIDSGARGGTADAYVANADLHMRLATTALACDLTRVVTLYVSQAHDELFGYQSVGGTANFHIMCHETNGSIPGHSLSKDEAALTIMRAYHKYNASLFAKFLGMLDAVPDVGGTTLLDNTLVVWCGQIGDGDHGVDHLPYVFGGSMGGAVTPGRFVMYPRKALAPELPNAWPVYSEGLPHNNLFVSLANAMGVPTEKFGNASVCTGPLAGLT